MKINKLLKITVIFVLIITAVLLVFSCNSSAEVSSAPAQENMMNLPPLKDSFQEYFLIGNIFNQNDVASSGISNVRLSHHYNVLTAENDMKPYNLSLAPGRYSFSTADRMVNAAISSGFKVVGHTLLWHSQIPDWQRGMANRPKDTALEAMKQYITDVVTHFKGRIYSWDVLNEVFPDGVRASNDWKTSMRTRGDNQSANPWFVAIGSDFVYEGFLAARLADPNAILYYNDYNMDQAGKATMVRNMVRDVNERYKAAYPGENRLLIEGIGMQSHHNIEVSTGNIRNSINLFRSLGVKISISELDVLSQSWSHYRNNTPVTFVGELTASILYADYFRLFMENSDIIERVSFWGVFDEQSWRARGKPLIFEGRAVSNAKPAYFRIMEALEERQNPVRD